MAERIRTLFREQGITITSVLNALSTTVSTIVLAITGVLWGGGGGGRSYAFSSKDEETWWLNR